VLPIQKYFHGSPAKTKTFVRMRYVNIVSYDHTGVVFIITEGII